MSCSDSPSVATSDVGDDLTLVNWQKLRKNCEVCAKKKITNPVNIYCRTCDKYFCHCCLICHQEFTTGHLITQHFFPETGKQHHQPTKDTDHKKTDEKHPLSSIKTDEEDNDEPNSKKQCPQQICEIINSKDCNLEKNESNPQNTDLCCGQGSGEENTKNLSLVPQFEESKRWSLTEVTTNTYITGITITDECNLFLCDVESKVFVYNLEGLLLSWCQIPISPSDICSISSAKLVTVSMVKRNLCFLEFNSHCKTLTFTASVPTENKLYCSICKSGKSFLLACDCFTNVDILNFDGKIISRVFTGRYLPLTSAYVHRICPGRTTCNFWLLDYNSQVISCCTLNGVRLWSQNLRDHNLSRTDDILVDNKSGLVYGCDVDKVYCMPSKDADTFETSIPFESQLITDARMCWSPSEEQLVICLETTESYLIKIFNKKIS